ncbi:hypothetical protein LVJ94_12335 [Pendulispora rubella]|uniref:PEGA domain-containing protein n=1 Tax=Pendulispora rubella TaxID=2741070 RepID=A0ABZ2LAR0_9BACT
MTTWTVLAATPVAAYAADTNVCVSSYEQSQSLRKGGKLRDARQRALECARDTCPAVLSRDCQRWITELDNSIPTVIFDVRGLAGEELTQVTVFLDGKKVVDRLDGKALDVDPGTHTFKFVPGGALKDATRESTIVIREGEKYRKVSASFEDKSISAQAANKSRPVPVATWVFGGIGVAGLAAGTFFALSGNSKKSDLDQCKPQCNPSDVDSMSRNYAIADIAFGVGVISGVAAVYLYLTRPTVEEAPPPAVAKALRSFSVAPAQGGAQASWGMQF